MSKDVALFSPVLTTPFRGRERAVELFAALFESVSDLAILEEFAGERSHVFHWRATTALGALEGVDLIVHDSDGLVSEVRVLIRPLVDVGRFSAVLGPGLAGNRGRLRGAAVRALTQALVGQLRVADPVATRLLQRDAV